MERLSLARTSQGDQRRGRQTASLPSPSSRVPSHPLRQLQLALGNQAVGRFIHGKLEVSRPGDTAEQEADRVAEEVMRLSEPGIQRACTECASGAGLCHECAATEETAQGAVAASTLGPSIQRGLDVRETSDAPGTSEEEDRTVRTTLAISAPGDRSEQEADRVASQVMRMADPASTGEPSRPLRTAPAALQGLSGRGQPLPAAARSFLEPRMGHDFSAVRVHTGRDADEVARSVGARAFTHRNHIVFRSGEYDPDSSAGRHVLAHELTHTIQQEALGDLPAIQRLGDTTKIPADLKCFVPNITGVNPGTSILFGMDRSDLSGADRSTLSSVAAAWHSSGGAGVLTVTGFASAEGSDEHNWRLSCDRATAVAREIEAPTDKTPGVPGANIRTNAQGETSEFSATALGPNRRVVITTYGGDPAPGPPCGLTITGPDDVDHYCAPYVPSDAASCGVYPAPAITLTATGAAPGATLRWSLTLGNIDRAYIDGPDNLATVNVRGYRPSIRPRDVTVQLTDGHCTVTHRLTVRQPSRLRVAEVRSNGRTFVQDVVTYTVLDQFGNAMGAHICVDETVTVCADSTGGPFRFHDAQTDAAGQVTDRLRSGFPGGLPADLCVKADQLLTAGGCGPLLRNTITIRPSGVTLTPDSSCAVGDPCP